LTFDVSKHFSDRANNMTASEIRELLKVTQRPGMISFAGGLPNPESFPIEIVGAIVEKVLRENGAEALQYGSTEGLRRWKAGCSTSLRLAYVCADGSRIMFCGPTLAASLPSP